MGRQTGGGLFVLEVTCAGARKTLEPEELRCLTKCRCLSRIAASLAFWQALLAALPALSFSRRRS